MIGDGVVRAPALPQRPVPVPSGLSAEYWRSAARGQLAIQRCTTCRQWHHPPVVLCHNCRGTDLTFEPVSGLGTIAQYVIVHQTKLAGFDSRVPYGAAAVQLDEQGDLVVVGNVLGCPPDQVRIGDRVRVEFEPIEDLALPQFRLQNDTEPDGGA